MFFFICLFRLDRCLLTLLGNYNTLFNNIYILCFYQKKKKKRPEAAGDVEVYLLLGGRPKESTKGQGHASYPGTPAARLRCAGV